MTFAKDYAVQRADETVWLLSERALWWPVQRTLMVADTHFGKAATFRTRGVPVPAGSTSQAVVRLDAVLARLPMVHIAWLGDFLHTHKAYAVIDVSAA